MRRGYVDSFENSSHSEDIDRVVLARVDGEYVDAQGLVSTKFVMRLAAISLSTAFMLHHRTIGVSYGIQEVGIG